MWQQDQPRLMKSQRGFDHPACTDWILLTNVYWWMSYLDFRYDKILKTVALHYSKMFEISLRRMLFLTTINSTYKFVTCRENKVTFAISKSYNYYRDNFFLMQQLLSSRSIFVLTILNSFLYFKKAESVADRKFCETQNREIS